MKYTVLCLLLAGCANPPVDNRSAEQIKASAADRSIEAQCVLATTPWGPQRTVRVTVDKQSINSGLVTATPDCQITIQADPKPPKGTP